ncbi:MAG: GNAT family acetyltransferase [Roseburia sp.]
MIMNEDILNINFYKKEKFTGSYQGMRYLIQKDSVTTDPPVGSDVPEEKSDAFRATIWPGPYNFDTTAEEKKTTAFFPFTADGKKTMVAWLNEQWEKRMDEWPKR